MTATGALTFYRPPGSCCRCQRNTGSTPIMVVVGDNLIASLGKDGDLWVAGKLIDADGVLYKP